jgi:folate-binding protein YgfZ
MDSPLLNHHRSAGAQIATFSGCALPDSFAPDWRDEWRLARETVTLFDTNWHATALLTGPDRVRYLNAIVSNDVQSLGEGQGTLALLLDARAHILAELEIYVQQDRLLVLSHASVRERTIATLDKYIIMDEVELEDATDRLGTIAVEGTRARIAVSQATGLSLDGCAEFKGEKTEIGGVACYLVRRSHFGMSGAQVIAPARQLATVWDTLFGIVHASGGGPMGMRALNTLRLEAGIPWFPLDFDGAVIPQEAALESTHLSFTKGCYTGQEIVERVRSRGHVNRRRVRLSFKTAEPPVAGTMLLAKEIEIGQVTSAAFSPLAGTAVGMGYLRAEYTSPGTTVDLEGGHATVLGSEPAAQDRTAGTRA